MKFIPIFIFVSCLAFAQEHAKILDHSIKYVIYNDEKAEIEEFLKMQINDEKAELFASYRDYTDQFRKITSVSLDIFDKDGKRVKRLRRNDGMEFSFNPSYEINDSKFFILQPEYKQFPYTVEIHSKVALDGFISFPTWLPRPYFNIAVDHSKLTVVSPINFPLKFKNEGVSPNTKQIENQIITEYEISNLLPIEKKIRYEDFYDEQPKVLISPKLFKLNELQGSTNSWAEFGNWFLFLNDTKFALSSQTKNFVDSVKINSPDQLVEKIYDFMQNKTRYVSIQLGIGGFKSLPTEEVDKTGYGDCKALTTYMKNMLRYAGIKSNYILVRAGNDVPDVIGEFPSNQFNHVFLGVPRQKDTLYLECTSQISPSNYLGTFTDDRNVLWVDWDKSSVIKSRVYTHKNNIQTNNSKIKLEETGDAVVEFNMQNEGTLFDEILLFKLAPPNVIKNHNLEKFNYNDFTIKNFEFKESEKNSAKLDLKYSIQVNGLAKVAGGKLVFPIVPTIPFSKYLLKDDFLKFYSIKRGLSVLDEVVVDIPDNRWIYNLPESTKISSEFGNYELRASFDGKQLKITRKMILFKGEYTKEKYDMFRSFYEKIEKAENKKLVFNSKT
jgi:hypothetical protein